MGFGPRELLILLVIALLLFGAKKLPDLARSMGRSARILKAEAKGLQDEDDGSSAKEQAQASDTPAPEAAQPNQAQQSAQGYTPPQPEYRQLPAGQRIVNEQGEPSPRSHGA